MFVTLHSQNRDKEEQKKSLLAAHIKGLGGIKQNQCLANKIKHQFEVFHKKNNQNVHLLSHKTNSKILKHTGQRRKLNKNSEYENNFINNPNIVQKKNIKSINPQSSENSKQSVSKQFIPNQQYQQKKIHSNQTTKANSRQKSRATSLQTSTAVDCCNFVFSSKDSADIKDQKSILAQKSTQQWKHVQNHKKQKPKVKKISKIMSPQITKIVRIIMLDWLFQLSQQIQLPRQSLYNSIQYIDKFVSTTQVKKSQYQKIGLACLYLATKLQTSSHPRIDTFLQAMNNQIQDTNLIQTQRRIVNTLKFKLNPPTLYQYMSLVLFTVKSFKSIYKNISWINELPLIQKGQQIYHRLYWMLDGIIMQGVLINKHKKQQICLCVMYLTILKYKRKQQYQKFQKFQKQTENNNLYFTTTNQSSVMSTIEQETSIISQFNQTQFNLCYQQFMSYATTTSGKKLDNFSDILYGLNKWMNYTCDCQDWENSYHEGLKKLAAMEY